jgi:hypothetical protein
MRDSAVTRCAGEGAEPSRVAELVARQGPRATTQRHDICRKAGHTRCHSGLIAVMSPNPSTAYRARQLSFARFGCPDAAS